MNSNNTIKPKIFRVYNEPIYYDFCNFEDCLLRRYYRDKIIDKTPYLYRLTIIDVYKLWKYYRFCNDGHLGFKFCENFFKPDYQKYFNSVINIIERIHESKIRNQIQKYPDSSILNYLINHLDTNFKVKFIDENNKTIKSINFHTPYDYEIIIGFRNCYNKKDEYIKIFFNHSKNEKYTIAAKFYYNGNLRILVFFKNEDIINPEFSYDLEEVKLDSDPDYY